MQDFSNEEFRQLQNQVTTLQKQVVDLANGIKMPDHKHTGFDVSRVSWPDLSGRVLHVYHTIQGSDAATAGFYGVFFIAPFPCYVSDFKEVHQTAGTAGGTVTVDLEKLTGTTAPDSGVSALASALSLKATINSVQTATLTNTLANRNLAVGDRLCAKDSGTLTSVANVTLFVELTLT